MSMYPSLEDMNFHQLSIAQEEYYTKQNVNKSSTYSSPPLPVYSATSSYPTLPITSSTKIYPSAPTHPNYEVAPSAPMYSANPTSYNPPTPSVPTVTTLSSHTAYPILPNQSTLSAPLNTSTASLCQNVPTAPLCQISPSAPLSPSSNQSMIPSQNSSLVRSQDISSLYPQLDNYMGLELANEVITACIRENEANERQKNNVVSIPTCKTMNAPLSDSKVLRKAYVTNGIRQLVLCKDAKGLIGLRVAAINEGVFVCLVENDSPAALVGLRFGDQIIQINNETVAGYNMKQVHKIFKECPVNNIYLVIRDRPFERTVSLHKDSLGHLGFQFKNGEIIRLVKDSSATRNGLLVNHQILEVNGQNVVGMKDKDLKDIVDKSSNSITLTIMPCYVYQHMMKKMSFSLVKDKMDHSI